MREFTFSLATGAVIAMVMCLVLPEIQTKIDVFGMYFPFWFCGTVVVWEIIDTAEMLMKERRRKQCMKSK